MFERGGFYGLRSILVLYLINDNTLGFSQEDAFKVYGWLFAGVAFAQIIGALLGDLLIGNKNSLIIGNAIQAIGAFCLILPSTFGFYAGLFILAVGTGLYTPNLFAHFGKSYLNKPKLLDSAFTGIYAMVNIGALIGTVLMGFIAEKFGYQYGFAMSGLFMLIALVFPIVAGDKELVAQVPPPRRSISTGQRIIAVMGVILAGALFWSIYELAGQDIYTTKSNFSSLFMGTKVQGIENYITEIMAIPIMLIAILLWRKFYTRSSLKFLIGIGFTAVAFTALSFIPTDITISNFTYFIGAMAILSIAEMCIAPLVFSVIAKYTDPRYLAIVISAAFIPGRIFSSINTQLSSRYYGDDILNFIGTGLLAVLLLGVVIYFLTTKDGILNVKEDDGELDNIGTE
jgi:POT family proton-dependent oligopeptide transporter